MTIRKRGDKWQVEIRRKYGADIYKTFNSKVEAQRYEAEQKILSKSGKEIIKRTLGEAFERYAREVSINHHGKRWEEVRLNKLSKDRIAQSYLDSITHDDIEDWIKRNEERGLADSTILRELGLISAVFNQAIRWRYCHDNPVKRSKKPKTPCGRERRISEHEIERICAALNYEDNKDIHSAAQATAVAFLLAIETGAPG